MREIDIDQVATAIEGGATVIDVRESGEYAEAHVPGAINIPMGSLMAHLHELDRTSPVHVICASGNRSAAMVKLLVAQGFDAVNVAGGTSAWVSSGRPVVRGAQPEAAR